MSNGGWVSHQTSLHAVEADHCNILIYSGYEFLWHTCGVFFKNRGTGGQNRRNFNSKNGLRCPTRVWDKGGTRGTWNA